MEYLREWFKGKDKKALFNISAAFVVGVLLLISGNTLFATKPVAAGDNAGTTDAEPVSMITIAHADEEYEEKLSSRLADILSLVEGAGDVKVMITLANSHETVIAEDGKYDHTQTDETDAQGGKRIVESLSTTGTKLTIRGEDGSVSPLIIKTIAPRVEGVIIAAQGGGDAVIKEQLIKAAQTVLGVEPHKVQVLKSTGKGR